MPRSAYDSLHISQAALLSQDAPVTRPASTRLQVIVQTQYCLTTPTICSVVHDLYASQWLALLQTVHAAVAANLPIFVFHPAER